MKINQKKVKEFYNNINDVWEHDVWHNYSYNLIKKFLNSYTFKIESVILNAGSAGNDYGIKCKEMIHVDIADKKLKGIKNSIVANIECMPLESDKFDYIICVGSVINYSDAFASLSEFYRVLKKNGILIFEYENSKGYEYLGKEEFKQDAILTNIIYMGEKHQQWLYSYKYIERILNELNFNVLKKIPFHICDGLLSHFICDTNAVNMGNILDKVCKQIPFIKNHGNNNIMICKK